MHLAIPDMLVAGIVELDDLRRHTARRDLLRVHMPPACGDIAKSLIAPSGEATGGQEEGEEGSSQDRGYGVLRGSKLVPVSGRS